jgi:hypothetical protein
MEHRPKHAPSMQDIKLHCTQLMAKEQTQRPCLRFQVQSAPVRSEQCISHITEQQSASLGPTDIQVRQPCAKSLTCQRNSSKLMALRPMWAFRADSLPFAIKGTMAAAKAHRTTIPAPAKRWGPGKSLPVRTQPKVGCFHTTHSPQHCKPHAKPNNRAG